MSGEVIQWRDRAQCKDFDVGQRLESLLAIFQAIAAGELLDYLPDCEVARAQHRTAVSLLAMAERELGLLCEHFSHG